MREKLLYGGILALSALYVIEVLSNAGIGVLQWIGLAIVAACVVPWAVSQFLAYRKNKRRKEEDKQFKEFKQQQKSQQPKRG